MSRSKAVTGLGDFLETWGKKLKNEPKPEPKPKLPRRTIEEEAKLFEERNKELVEAIKIRESLASGVALQPADYYRGIDNIRDKLNIRRYEADALVKNHYNGDPRLYLNEYYSKKYPKDSSIVNDNVKTPNTEPLGAPITNEPIRDETLTDVPLKNEPPNLEASNNATEAVIPGAEAINTTTTATATTEVPKDPSSAGILKNALSKFRKNPSNKNLDPKDSKDIRKILKIIAPGAPGAIVGGVSGEFVTDDDASWQKHLNNILAGAALGAGGKLAYHQLRPKLPSKGKILKYGAELATIGGGLYYKENIKDYANKLWNPTTSKPEDTSPPIGTPLGTPANTPVNTNRQASRSTSKYNTNVDDF